MTMECGDKFLSKGTALFDQLAASKPDDKDIQRLKEQFGNAVIDCKIADSLKKLAEYSADDHPNKSRNAVSCESREKDYTTYKHKLGERLDYLHDQVGEWKDKKDKLERRPEPPKQPAPEQEV
jgi:hypothetical protein